MNIAIFGANGPTGRLLTEQALAAGHSVTAFTRHADAFPIRHEHLRVIQGDALELGAVEMAVAGQDAVLSTLGTKYSRKPISLYSVAIANVIKAMHDNGVRRLACVSSSVTDPVTRSRNTGGGVVFEKVLKPFITNVVGKTMYADLLRMEQLVMGSDLDWTIVRPSGLFETPSVTEYRLAEDLSARTLHLEDRPCRVPAPAGDQRSVRAQDRGGRDRRGEAADGQDAAEGGVRHLHRGSQDTAGGVKVERSTRPGRTCCGAHSGSCCSDQVLPSGSLKVTNEPHGWTSISLAATPWLTSCSRAAATSATTTWTPRCEPGGMSVMPVPMTIEHAEPGGVSCTKRSVSVTW